LFFWGGEVVGNKTRLDEVEWALLFDFGGKNHGTPLTMLVWRFRKRTLEGTADLSRGASVSVEPLETLAEVFFYSIT